MYRLLSGVFLGWSLGANHLANNFGTAVFSKKIRYRTAVILCAVFVIAGALLEGQAGMHTLGGLVEQTANSAFAATLAAALTTTLMSVLKLPISTSQAMVGAIIGIGLLRGEVNLSGLTKVVIAWIATPVGTIIATLLLYPLIGRFFRLLRFNIFTRDLILKWGLIVAGCYGSYALGANNVANVTGLYTQTGQLTVFQATLVGGGSIALGVLTYGRNVMITVGKKLVSLDPFSAFIAVFSMALVVHGFAIIGVPVSTSQGIVGSVLGIGILKGVQTIKIRTLVMILFGWIGTPSIALVFSYLFFRFFYL
jgi:PiT family inorganic phosphate transporter